VSTRPAQWSAAPVESHPTRMSVRAGSAIGRIDDWTLENVEWFPGARRRG
jgi:hypothetical protein